MVKKTLVFICLGALFCGFAADLAAKDGGYALIDRFIKFFHEMAAASGVLGNKPTASQTMDALMTEAVQAKTQGKIDAVFFSRYTRLLRVFKLSLVDDPSHLLAPLVNEQIAQLVEDVTGQTVDPAKDLLGPFADAMAEELINLQMYLDGSKEKARLKDEFMRKFSPGESKK